MGALFLILAFALCVPLFVAHRAAAQRSPLYAERAGDDAPLPPIRESRPAMIVTELLAIGIVVAAVRVAEGPAWLTSTAATLGLGVGLLALAWPRLPQRTTVSAWMSAVARVWPTGIDARDGGESEPIALAADADPFDSHVLLERVNRLGETDIAEVMVPRGEVIGVHHDADVRTLFEVVEEHRHSRYPIIEGDLDHVVGIVNVFDVQNAEPDAAVLSFGATALMVPETKSAVELLDEMSRGDASFAVIVDEFGGTSGVVTMEDLVEQLVGEIWDEHEHAEVRMRRVGKDVYVCEAAIPLNEVELRLGLRFPEGDYETVAGFLLEEFGRIPVRGDAVSYENMVLEVLIADRRRIESVQIDLRPRKG